MIYAVNKRTKEHVKVIDDGAGPFGFDLGWVIVQADDAGWIPWDGGECPLPDGAFAEVRFRDHRTKLVKASNMLILWNHKIPTRHDIIEYRPVLDADTKPNAPAWNGEGLPPVGCECEVDTSKGWFVCTIVYEDGDFAIGMIHEDQDTPSMCDWSRSGGFRPIRSAEDREVDDALDAIGAERGDRGYEEGVVLRMIRAGYRKVSND